MWPSGAVKSERTAKHAAFGKSGGFPYIQNAPDVQQSGVRVTRSYRLNTNIQRYIVMSLLIPQVSLSLSASWSIRNAKKSTVNPKVKDTFKTSGNSSRRSI
jgi:hypothetical protein